MSAPFIPLTIPGAPAGVATAAQIKLLALDRGREAQVPNPSIASHASGPASIHACGQTSSPARPVVTLLREGDQVTRIRIQCACGELIELECLYS